MKEPGILTINCMIFGSDKKLLEAKDIAELVKKK